MSKQTQWLINFIRDEDGPTTVEYAIILLTIVATCMASLVFLSDALNRTFNFVANAF